jgi:hypothetical protein
VLLTGDGKGNFKYVDQLQSGLKITGCIRDFTLISNKEGKKILMAGINNGQPVFISY